MMTDAELAILSIIAEAPITGLDIQAVIDERNLRRWTLIGTESVYYLIKKLEKQSLIDSTGDPDASTKERQYRLTKAGFGVLQTAITDMLSSPRHLPHSFDLGLANLPTVSTEQARGAMMRYRANLNARKNQLETHLTDLQKDDTPFHVLSMYQHQIALSSAELLWFDEWFKEWEALNPNEVGIQEPRTPSQLEQDPMKNVILPHSPNSPHKRPTRAHIDVMGLEENNEQEEGVAYPPPPNKRPSAQDKTRYSHPTPPHITDDPKDSEA